MTESLIVGLSRIAGPKVISRNSAMLYKDARKPLPEIARELAVQGGVTRSAQKEGHG